MGKAISLLFVIFVYCVFGGIGIFTALGAVTLFHIGYKINSGYWMS